MHTPDDDAPVALLGQLVALSDSSADPRAVALFGEPTQRLQAVAAEPEAPLFPGRREGSPSDAPRTGPIKEETR